MADYSKTTKSHGQEKGSNRKAAPAAMIGEPFHNPYTFIPFPKTVPRHFPTALTADEQPSELHRRTGMLELEIKTLSPLMSCDPVPLKKLANGHEILGSLTIGDDVILPATGIRGALRTLMTILSGGTLGYMDETLRLLQGRDVQLGPSSKMPNSPDHAFLAEVVKPGRVNSPGTIRLGETRLIKAEQLKKTFRNLDGKRPSTAENPFYLPGNGQERWKVKLSGHPILKRGKQEGLFKPGSQILELLPCFWQDYQWAHRHAARKTLKAGDLVWLEPSRPDIRKITCAEDIRSLQWARWGKRGQSLEKAIPQVVRPDSLRNDGGVDMVTDLFGQVPLKEKAAGPFAARIRPGNLVFFDAAGKVVRETLAPMAQPHPGCVAFYRDGDDLDILDGNSPLKGYKVYRNTTERGDKAPWKYRVQGVYGKKGDLETPEQQPTNKTADLLEEGLTGRLRIAYRALDADELSLLYLACTVDWKLGGGKPLGLGHCRVVSLKQIDEKGNSSHPLGQPKDGGNLELTPSLKKQTGKWAERVTLYKASQVPVKKLRYPRAVTLNNNRSNKAGLSWFTRHAALKKGGKGLETMWTKGLLQQSAGASQIKAQALPSLDSKNPDADLLYGYDMVALCGPKSRRNQTLVEEMLPFDAKLHARTNEKHGDNRSQNRASRQQERDQRVPDSPAKKGK